MSKKEEQYIEGQRLLARAFKGSQTKCEDELRRTSLKSVPPCLPQTKSQKATVLKEGVLLKEGRHRNWTPAYGGIGMYPWKRRWVKVFDDGRIEWRTKRDQKTPNGSIHVNEYRVSEPSRMSCFFLFSTDTRASR